MRELNKEECLEALNRFLIIANQYYADDETKSMSITNDYYTLIGAINECFDNPPLKFEELQLDTLVWDNKYKKFLTIKETRIDLKTKRVVFYENIGENGIDIFANNRFFLKGVK